MKKLMFIGFLMVVLVFFLYCKKSLPTALDIPKTLESTTPTINHFTADPTLIVYNSGDSSTLSWSVSNATKVEISQGIGTVSLTGSTEVSPNKTTEYLLTASNSGNFVAKAVTVTVPEVGNVIMIGEPELNIYDTVAVWTGEVKNIGNSIAYYTKVEVTLYDYNGQKIYSSYDKPESLKVQVDAWQGTLDGSPSFQTSTWKIRWGTYYGYKNEVDFSKTKFEITWSDTRGW